MRFDGTSGLGWSGINRLMSEAVRTVSRAPVESATEATRMPSGDSTGNSCLHTIHTGIEPILVALAECYVVLA